MSDANDTEKISFMKLVELKEELRKRKLKMSGNKKELQDRLRAAVMFEIEHGVDEDDEDEEDESENEEDDVVQIRPRTTAVLTFKDVEESMNTFSGDDKVNVRVWVREFEEMIELCQWSDVQNVIYARRLLQGSAELFVKYEKCCKSWKALKEALISEFSQKIDAHQVHKELSYQETYQEYIYRMLEIAKQVDMENAAVIKYIIDGVQDDEVNKTILYGARTIREIKEKFVLYETMKENAKPRTKLFAEKPKKPSRINVAQETTVKRCFLCGDRNHLSSDCPTKGSKCFKCRGYGHIAPKCPGVEKSPKDACSASQSSQAKRCKEVDIANSKIVALVDTGSDLTLMRADQYIKIGQPKLGNRVAKFRGIGCESNCTLGEFSTNVTIDDFLDSVELNMKEGGISIRKLEDCNNSNVPEVFKIDVEAEVNELDLSHITYVRHKQAIEGAIENYKPEKIREVGVKMSLILQDEIPVYERPRRLSPQDKLVLDVASKYGLLINWDKCRFLQTRVEYLGHIVENGNIQPSEHKTKAVMNFPKPQCTRDVQSFLGLTGYFRKFEQIAFEKLKLILSSKPVLKLYRMGVETELHTDASSLGYGAILMQRDCEDDNFHPIYFASGKTTPAEEKYSSYELEVEDSDLRKIRDDIDEHLGKGYVLKNEILYRVINDTPLVVVPKAMRAQVVRQAHERGHFGINKTEAIVKRDYWFEGMRPKKEEARLELEQKRQYLKFRQKIEERLIRDAKKRDNIQKEI
ncbi:uncharacterized protein LOC143363555 [Halictus rubicundus]|uniref:uncharacterized protein LOC143363555 n=1 Tax=Halictus rubicundus TaxID=77578 RepID=UPI00403680BB